MQDAHIKEASVVLPVSGPTEIANNFDLRRWILIVVRPASGC